jgi:Flp pilus assembly CpaF family ATPase
MPSMLHGSHLGVDATQAYIRKVVDIVIQLARTNSGRQIVEINYLRRA